MTASARPSARRPADSAVSTGTTTSECHRDAVRGARSIVVKIGTTALTDSRGLFDPTDWPLWPMP